MSKGAAPSSQSRRDLYMGRYKGSMDGIRVSISLSHVVFTTTGLWAQTLELFVKWAISPPNHTFKEATQQTRSPYPLPHPAIPPTFTMFNLPSAINGFLKAVEERNVASMDSFLQSCLAGEYTLRRIFATDPENPLAKSPYIGLFDVFDLPFRTRLAQPRDWDSRETDFVWEHEGRTHRFPQKHILPVQPHLQRAPESRCMVDNLDAFLFAWKTFSGDVLKALMDLDWDHMGIGGGSVLACLTFCGSDPSVKDLFEIHQSTPYKNSDIDLFLWGMTEAEAKKKMEEIFNAINSSLPWDAVCFRTKNTITIQTDFPKRPVQIIMRLYKSPAEILCGFDVDCCCLLFNGTNVFTNPRGMSAIIRQCNTIDLLRRSPSYEHRLAKYSLRGYEVFYPSLERSRIDYTWLADPERSAFPKGLGRLIVYEIMAANYQYFPRLYEDHHGYIRSTPVPVDRLRPSNYDYAWCKIPYGPKWWDTLKVKDHVRRVGREIILAVSDSRRRQGLRALPHCHVIVSGTMTECLERCCDCHRSGNSGREGPTFGSLGLFNGPATFIVDDPGRQLIGSFNPCNYGDWEAEAYIDLEEPELEDDE